MITVFRILEMLMYEEDHIKDSSGDEPEPLATLYGAPVPPAPEPDQSNIDMVEENLNAMMQMDASYSFKYDNEFSSREETADPNGDVKGCSRHLLKVEVWKQI